MAANEEVALTPAVDAAPVQEAPPVDPRTADEIAQQLYVEAEQTAKTRCLDEVKQVIARHGFKGFTVNSTIELSR